MIYEIWIPDNGGIYNVFDSIEAENPYEAAEKWAALEDECDARIADDERTIMVCVRRVGTRETLEMFVSGELQRVYSARLKVGGEG